MGRRKGPRHPKPEGVASNSRQQNQSNRQTKAAVDAAIRNLMHGLPETDLTDLLFTLLEGGMNALDPRKAVATSTPEDRHAAIVGAAAIEHGLKRTIGLHLAEDADRAAVFENYPSAPLSGFADRIVMARALGIIDELTTADLNVIRRIRNIFAHSIHPIFFRTPEVTTIVSELKIMSDPNWDYFDQLYREARARYLVTCAVHVTALNQYTFIRPDPVDEVIRLARAYAHPASL